MQKMVFMGAEIFGLAGMLLIIVAWIPGIIDTIRTKKPGMKRRFMLLYFLGSALLAYYALLLNSLPFLVLNLIAAAVPMVHFYFYLTQGKGQ